MPARSASLARVGSPYDASGCIMRTPISRPDYRNQRRAVRERGQTCDRRQDVKNPFAIVAGRTDPWQARVAAAGCTAKTARVGEIDLGYSEGPDNGPPLLLLHAQHLDRHSYSRVLPALV